MAEDLREAAGNLHESSPLWHADGSEELDGFGVVESFPSHPLLEKLSAIVRIESVVFPPAGRLTENQQATLYSEMEALLAAYFFEPDFPDGLPVTLRYQVLRAHWDDQQVYLGEAEGKTYIEFCDCVVEECPFPSEFCECRLVGEEQGDDREMDEWKPSGND